MKKKPNPETTGERSKPYPIVAIGASAGGLEAVTQLLRALPADTGMAYVYIQHLDPTHKSMLTEILQRVTGMKVLEARNMLKIEPNHLYIIPPNKEMVIADGMLKLEPRPARPILHLPVNQFFISLAENQQAGAIGIVLSGNASDGAIGLKAIKMAGGLTFAQDESAKFKGMPKSAVAEGGVDLVLSPEEIAGELERLGKHPGVLLSAVSSIEEKIAPDEDLNNILLLLKKFTGVDFMHYKKSTIKRRVMRRVLLYKMHTLKEYFAYLEQTPKEISILYQDLLINVTAFFREPEAFDYLKEQLFPRILQSKTAGTPVRIWVPACSTGQEAYSIAMLFMEILGEKIPAPQIYIFATDLSETAIAKARLGSYTRDELADISPERLGRFFTKVDSSYRIVKAVRDICVFATHNIFNDPPISRLDFVSCCNLLIYLDTVLQKKIMNTFHYALKKGGFLMLGKSETIGASDNLFSTIEGGYKIYARKNTANSNAILDLNYRPAENGSLQPFAKKKPEIENYQYNNPEKTLNSILLANFMPPCVVIDKELEILQFRGATGRFLEPSPGRASLNLLKMARHGLGFDLKTAVHKVIKSGKPFKKDGIEVELDGKLTSIAIEVIPFKDEDEDNYLVVFKETPLAAALPASKSSAARIKQLEQELIAAREDMRSVIEEQERVTEELQSANEEIVSSNEELQSINEELETSKEELESGNEELMTINHELQTRNNQLAEAQEYAEAIFSTIREAVIVLDGDLRVKSANSAFYSIFNVFENETVGRKIYELGNGQWNIPPLRKLMEDVIPKNALITGYEVRHTFPDIGYKVMRLNARRVIHITHRQLFILLSVQDITEHETALEIIKNREIIFREMANNAPVMIWVADKTRNRNFFNSTWLEYTGKTMEQEAGTGWKDGIHEEDIKGFLHAYIENFEARKPFHLEYRLRRNDGEYRWVLDNGKPTFDLNGEFTGFTGSCTEIHDRRLLYQELEKKVQERTSDLKEANDSLERSNSELQQFAYVASHDLQEPLRKIVTFSDRLKEKYSEALPTEAKDYVGRIITSAQRMTGLIDDLLNFSKVIKLDDQFKKADLNAIIRNLKREFEVSISQKNAKVTADKLPVINAIPVQINQLFYNLIGNALKFATDEKPPEISITVQLPGAEMLDKFNLKKYSKYYEIIVKDNGIGFSQEYAEQIFVIFQRLNERKQYPGTGIGLALCRKIVNYHDGAIFSRSREGDGAEFHIILPDRKEKQLPVN